MRCNSRLLLGPVAVVPTAVIAVLPFGPAPATSLREFAVAVIVASLLSLLLQSGLCVGFVSAPQEVRTREGWSWVNSREFRSLEHLGFAEAQALLQS